VLSVLGRVQGVLGKLTSRPSSVKSNRSFEFRTQALQYFVVEESSNDNASKNSVIAAVLVFASYGVVAASGGGDFTAKVHLATIDMRF